MGSIFGGGGNPNPPPSQAQSTSSQYTGLLKEDKPAISQLISRGLQFGEPLVTSRFANPVPTPNAMGFLPEQMGGVNQLLNQIISQVSGNYASRGMLNPGHSEAVAGSALTNALPMLLPLITQNVQYRETAESERLSDFARFIAAATGALGGAGESQSSTTGATAPAPGVGFGFLDALTRGFGQRIAQNAFASPTTKLPIG